MSLVVECEPIFASLAEQSVMKMRRPALPDRWDTGLLALQHRRCLLAAGLEALRQGQLVAKSVCSPVTVSALG